MQSRSPRSRGNSLLTLRIFELAFGLFLGLSLLKFGNPPIMEKWVTTPKDFFELVFGYPWPIRWAYTLVACLAVLGLVARRFCITRTATSPSGPLPRRQFRTDWWLLLPLLWLGWQFISFQYSVDKTLSGAVIKHFLACVTCFYLGYFCLGLSSWSAFFFGVLLGLSFVVIAGCEQHFGGLAETRQYFLTYVYPQNHEIPPEYWKKINSQRIFATLFYPNSLAGALLLLLPPCLAFIGLKFTRLTPAARGLLCLLLGLPALACLYWSGSKGGWLLMLLSAAWLVLPLIRSKRHRLVFITLLALAGLTGFFVRHAGFFAKGATSVGARLDY